MSSAGAVSENYILKCILFVMNFFLFFLYIIGHYIDFLKNVCDQASFLLITSRAIKRGVGSDRFESLSGTDSLISSCLRQRITAKAQAQSV